MQPNIFVEASRKLPEEQSPIIYIRTSTQEQEPLNQIKACQEINKWGEPIIIEEKQSAWQDFKERDKFNALKELIAKNKVRHLIVWDFDRIYRSRIKFVQFMELCKNYNCQIHSYRQQWIEDIYNIPPPWNDIMSKMMLQIMGWLGEEESNKKSERVKAAIRKKDGKTLSYKGKKWGRKSVSKQFKTKVHDLRSQGKSIREIANALSYYDKNGHPRKPAVATVHKIVSEIS